MGDNRNTCWSVTINNPTQADEEGIALARQKGWKVEGQLESGEEGTKHYQLMVRTPQVRFSAMKKQFPRAHIEPARNPSALSQYVAKEETRVATLATSQEKYPSKSKYWILVTDYLVERNAVDFSYVFNTKHERPDSVWFKEAPRRWRQDPLIALDEATNEMIELGYYVESYAVNPQVRSEWRKFHAAIIIRSIVDKGRQTDNCVQIVEEEVEVVNIPHADDPPRS